MRAIRYNTFSHKKKEVVRALINAGADVNAKTDNGTTALMLATWFKVPTEIITMLLEAGANITAKNNDGMTALDFARKNRMSENESVLLEAYKAHTKSSMNNK